MYDCFPIDEKSNGNGIPIFNFERNDQHAAPHGLTGFSADIHLGQRTKAIEIKVSNKFNFDEKKALEKQRSYIETKEMNSNLNERPGC